MIISVLLTILKVIGIILAAILGLVIFIVLLLLFVPIRYSASGYRTGLEGDPPLNAKAYVSWICHIVHLKITYSGEIAAVLRIFGIPVYRYPAKDESKSEKKEKKIRKEKSEKKAKKKDKKNKSSSVEPEEINSIDAVESGKAQEFTDYKSNIDAEYSDDIGSNTEFEQGETEDKAADSEKKSIFSRIKELVDKIRCTIKRVCDKIKSTIYSVLHKTRDIKKDIHYYHAILTSDLFERVYEKAKKKLIWFLKSILPRKIKLGIEAGFDDPYTTGELMAIAGILYPVLGPNVSIVGNFEENIIKGAGRFRGRIYGMSLLIIVIYYFTDRDLNRLIRLFKKEEKKTHGRK